MKITVACEEDVAASVDGERASREEAVLSVREVGNGSRLCAPQNFSLTHAGTQTQRASRMPASKFIPRSA